MKLFLALTIIILLQSCSFDNKTGIWKNDNQVTKKSNDIFKEFTTLSTETEVFKKIQPIKKNYKFKLSSARNVSQWSDIYSSNNNSFKHFKYKNLNNIIFKSKKITKHKINKYILYENENVILSDQKGNLIVFSINENQIIRKINFYKKKHKNIKKILNYIIKNNIIYVSDNLGYLYAYDYNKDQILWAKNHKVPFRSNLKIFKNKLIAVDQSNKLIIINKDKGVTYRSVPTEETTIKNKFINNLSMNNRSIYLLNTYGSLYSLNKQSMRANWFLNFNQSIDINPSNLFQGNEIINNDEIIVITSNNSTYILDAFTGSTLYKKNFTSVIKPLLINNYLFLITKNNLLIALNVNNGKIIYSYDINQKISEFLDTKKKTATFKQVMMIDEKIFIFLKNSYILKLNVDGTLEEIVKLPGKLNTYPMIIDNTLLYLNYKNKLLIVN